MKKMTILMFAADPGGANSIAVLSRYLTNKRYRTVILARREALKHLNNKGYSDVTLIDETINQYSLKDVESRNAAWVACGARTISSSQTSVRC